MNFLLNRKKVKLTLYKASLSIGLLAYIVLKADMDSVFKTLKNVDMEYYFYAISIFFLSQPLKTIRWGIFLREKHVFVSQTKLLVLYFIGMFFNTFLPTIFAGDAIRSYYIYKEYHSKKIPATSVIIERFCGLFTLFIIGLISSFYWLVKFGQLPFINTSFSLCLTAVIIMILLISTTMHKMISQLLYKVGLKTVWNRMERVYSSFRGYAENKKALLYGFLLSVLTSASTIIIGYCFSLSLSWDIPFYVFLYTIPIITITTMLPVSFGGVGVRETAFYVVFSQYGVAGSSAIALALLWYSVNIISGAIGGLCYAFYRIESQAIT